ncbi:MAG: ATP-binding cassette domain-containing protein [Tissierellia bacterium]|nr:ATP-binding cassette domain-containing protein [Tissierellia bacterium]
MTNILEVRNLFQNFQLTKSIFDKYKLKSGKIVKEEKVVHAVNGVSFNVKRGSVFSLVGESGCGKSTVARTAIKLLEPKKGTIHFNGEDITNKSGKSALEFRKNMQMIFQDPYASLNPRYSVKDIVMEPLLFHNKNMTKVEAEAEVLKLLETVGIRPEQASRFPHQFSGGQRQRIGVARALAVKPKLIIADEPVSALDVSIQAQILNLLIDLKNENDLSYLFIAHDLSVVKHISDEIGVMYLGKIVEQANKNDLFDNPLHPYTKLLLSSIPTINEEILVEKIEAKGEIPSPINLPMGCYFSNRCPYVMDVCLEKFPDEKEIEPGHLVSCHLY